MAEAHEADDEIFVYMGGDQEVPRDVVRVRIDKSVKIIPTRAFQGCRRLIDVDFHDGIEKIEAEAFHGCTSLRGAIKLLGVKIIEGGAFTGCENLEDVEFGVELETIEGLAFYDCTSLRSIIMPSVRTIGSRAFIHCYHLTDLDLPQGLDAMGEFAFGNCHRLRRITMPLKVDMIANNSFVNCSNLKTLDLVGRIHKTVARCTSRDGDMK
eukprot:scaffold1907_cov73-Skeletonema_dohrnii-CCMP3373.AAC.16